MPVMLDLELRPGSEAPARARRSLEGLARLVPPEVLDALRLLVSELVTNSVRHGGLGAGDRVRVVVTEREDRIRVEVTDPGRGFVPSILEPEGSRPSGWGLYLVDRVAERWGVIDDGATKVWFELPARS
jgi:anti-sigma regulatory factor (Ser/Thr protein kinase)